MFVPDGVKETAPVEVSVLLAPTVKLPLTVVVPPAAPSETVVAAPPMFKVVAIVLNKLAVVFWEMMSALEAPLTMTPLCALKVPETVAVPSTVKLPLVERSPALVMVVPVEP